MSRPPCHLQLAGNVGRMSSPEAERLVATIRTHLREEGYTIVGEGIPPSQWGSPNPVGAYTLAVRNQSGRKFTVVVAQEGTTL